MGKLILHVGPGKCGSSTIQTFFNTYKHPCIEETKFIILEPKEITKINRADPAEESINYFTKLLDENIKLKNTLILSHEYLFDCQYSIKNICSISWERVDEILIIGYSRKQSGYAVSSYSQWLFRLSDRVKEVKDVMLEFGIDPVYFSGVERQLIASIINDFYSIRNISNALILNWNEYYTEIENHVSSYDVKIRCGVLPDKNSTKNLIQDFCDRTGLTIKKEFVQSNNSKVNISFNNDIVEAVNNAIEFGLLVPAPNDDNDYFNKISNIMSSNILSDDEFIFGLKEYIDAYFYGSNMEFCKKFELDKSYFGIANECSKDEILDIIRSEETKRIKDKSMLKKYKELNGAMAEAFFNYYKIQQKESIVQANLKNSIKSSKKDFGNYYFVNWLKNKLKRILH